MTSRAGVAGVVALLAGAGCAGGEKGGPPEAAAVRVAEAGTGTVREWLTLFGRAAPPPDRDATLAPQVPGVLLSVVVREGQAVSEGQVVARVDAAPLDDAVLAAEAGERRAESEASFRAKAAERTQDLFQRGVASRQEAEADAAAATAARSSLAEAGAALATARRRRAWAELKAPFDGVVVKVLRRAGEPVDGTPATGVVELAAPRPVEIAAAALADSLQAIRPGAVAEVSLRDGAAPPLAARVARVARAVDAATGAGEVRLSLQDPAPSLILGTPVSVRIVVKEHPAAVVVPETAVRRGPAGQAEVVVVVNAKAVVRTVATGAAEAGRIEISSGLAAGEQVVVENPVGLVDGAPVDVRP